MARASTARTKKATAPAKKSARKAAPSKRSKKTASAARSVRTGARPAKRSGGTTASALSFNKLHQVALQATNLDEAVAFYRDVLGLRFIARIDPPGLAFFDMGGFRLLLSATASEATLYFRVADINAAVKQLKKRGVSFLQPPAMIHCDETGEFGKKGVEEWMAFFKDPSGNLLALTELR